MQLLLTSGDWETLIQSFATAVLHQNRMEAAAVAHRIKGSALNLHLPHLATIAKEAETIARSTDAPLEPIVQDFQEEWTILKPLLEKTAAATS